MFTTILVFCWLHSFGLSYSPPCGLGVRKSNNVEPEVARGWEVSVIATSLHNPRSMVLDNYGDLIVLSQSYGMIAIELQDLRGNCVEELGRHNLIKDASVSTRDLKALLSTDSNWNSSITDWLFLVTAQRSTPPRLTLFGLGTTMTSTSASATERLL